MDPECDKKLKKALGKQSAAGCGVCIIPLILFISIMMHILGEATFTSEWYNVSKQYGTGDIYVSPKIGPHTKTLIFLHPLTGRAS